MGPEYRELAEALRTRVTVIGDREFYARDPAGHLAQLSSVSAQILQLQQCLPAPVNPQLDHFLKRCSYDKALAFIETLDT